MGINRDEICAQRIGFIADMGGMEEEIIVYGCCYLENGRVKYRVSNEKEEMYQFLLSAASQNRFPTPVQNLTVRQIIAAGEKDTMLYQAKKKLAQKLQLFYPAAFFKEWQPFVEQQSNYEAWTLLEALQDEMEGLFEADELQFYEAIMRHCCQKKLLDEQHKAMGEQWLKKNRSQMEGDVVVKENNKRTFYGILYLKEDGSYGSKSNLELERVVDAKITLEQQGILTGPILTKIFWYQQAQQLPQLHSAFERWMKDLAGDRLRSILRLLDTLPSAVNVTAYRRLLAEVNHLPTESLFALQWYGQLWNVH